MANRHSQLVRACLDYLTLLGYLAVPIKNIATPRKDKRTGETRWSRGLIRPGVSDILACSPYGRWTAVEVKVRDRRGRLDKLRPDQLRFKLEVEQRGGLFVVVEDNTQALIDLRRGGML